MSAEEKLKRQEAFDQYVAKAGEDGLTDKEKKDIQGRARKLKDVDGIPDIDTVTASIVEALGIHDSAQSPA